MDIFGRRSSVGRAVRPAAFSALTSLGVAACGHTRLVNSLVLRVPSSANRPRPTIIGEVTLGLRRGVYGE